MHENQKGEVRVRKRKKQAVTIVVMIIMACFLMPYAALTAAGSEISADMTAGTSGFQGGAMGLCGTEEEYDAVPFSAGEEATAFGIDVSTYQGTIDWATVAEHIDFAILRCGYGDDLVNQDDKMWKYNADECTRLGIPFGVYIYSYALSDSEAVSEAQHVLRLVEGYDPQLPIYLDLEDNLILKHCTTADILRQTKIFCEIIEEAGYEVGIYANYNWWTTYLTSPEYDQWDRWIAHYTSAAGYSKEYTIWQYTSSGRVEGITGNVDLNYWYGEFPPSSSHTHTYTSDISVEATCTQPGSIVYTCSCGDSYTESIPAAGHSYTSTVTAPTCTDPGYTTYHCAVCGDSYVSDFVEAGHTYVDGICAVCGEEKAPAYTVTYTSASISLAGDIGVNYYAQLSDDVVADEGAYMQFTVAGKIQTVPLSEAVVDTDGTYRFTCLVAAKQMTENITGQFYLSDGTAVGEAKVYSVKAYCDAAIPVYSQYPAYADLVELMEAMLNYGGYSQTQFGYNTDNLANAGLDTTLPTITAADVDAYAHGATGSEDGISVASVSLLLESTTTIRFYFELDGNRSIDEYTFYVDGVETTPIESNGQYYVDKVNVAAKDLDEMVTVTVGGLTVKYCGLSYVRQVAVLHADVYSGNLVNAAKALYAYNQAANAYFA